MDRPDKINISRRTRLIAAVFLSVAIIGGWLVGGVGLALAQTPVQPVTGTPGGLPIWTQLNPVKEGQDKALAELADEALSTLRYSILRASEMLSRQFASQLAKTVASGGEGLQSLANLDTWGAMFNKSLSSAAGEFIGTFSEKFFGDKNILCSPNPNVQLQIALGMFDAAAPTPKCDLEAIKDHYQSLGQELESGEFLKRVQASFSPTASESGKFVSGLEEMKVQQALRVSDQLSGKTRPFDFGDVLDKFTWKRKTSSRVLQEYVDEGLIKGSFEEGRLQALGAIITGSLAVPFVNQFTMTLTSELLQKWLTGLWGVKDICDIPNRSITNQGSRAGGGVGENSGTAYGGTGWMVPDFCAELT